MQEKRLKLGLFPKPYMFAFENKGLVIEKERDVVCVYATNAEHTTILASVPLGAPKLFRKEIFHIREVDKQIVTVSVGDFRLVIDYHARTCANNQGLRTFVSERRNEDCGVEWTDAFNAYFEV